MGIRIRHCKDQDSKAWSRYVASHNLSCHYHQYSWRAFYAGYYLKQTYYLAALDEDKFVGILPLVRQKSALFGDYLVSLPFVNYGGVLADDEAAANALLSAAADLGEEIGVSHIELREYRSRQGYPCREEKVAMRLDLPDSEEKLGKALGAKLRSQIRRPMRENPTIHVGGLNRLGEFYTVFSRCMRDLGTPVYPRSMFEDIVRQFPGDTDVVIVERDFKPVAAALLIHYQGVTEVPWASSDRRFNRYSYNMLLYWKLLCRAIERGSTTFDFGRSTKDSGTYRFKKQWGAKPVQLYWNYWLAPGASLPNLSPENEKYSIARKVWQRLPIPLAEFIGPHVVKHLP
jgi:FemAB-related protein (PEP-CTERM system-associated)